MVRKKKQRKSMYIDYGILIPYLFLSITGIIMVYSATSYNLVMAGLPESSAAVKQGIFFVIGLVLVGLIYKMKTSFLKNKKLIMTAVVSISLLLVLTLIFAEEVKGARAWLSIGPIQIQPAEFLKIILIWFLADVMSTKQQQIVSNFYEAMKRPLMIVGMLIFLVLIQPDTGGAAILVLMVSIMLLASGISYWYGILFAGGGIALSSLVIEAVVLSKGKIFPKKMQYVYKRFETFRNPFGDAYGDGHQMINSYYAMFNGGLFGLGLGNSIQKKGFLPEAQNDFIFSIVVEELGVIAAIFILLVLLFLILRIMMIGIKSNDTFNSLICIGFAGLLLIQTFVNVGGITGIIPLTGVTFPFVSQGGSSLLTLSIGIGFVLNIRADELKQRRERQEQVVVPMHR
ncbi:FtsW/RodA/SpoVE family cell cycle protein [Vagococcus lutrae]|uniref:Probable peptidoglycan glycosyltransferase FtsW n=1 Tax=Vagococcus lutrae TaxID=81947 RepID=A0AAF0BH63_9ENTE|nr:FtsW/RodA/SpoVE family cell cycle protein [Vagococcus lutrae]WCG22582.1 FtsW/RodA/SpoVE family cell cycle protein [Vagococcus lutrae]